MKPAIVVVAYNRSGSLRRLLDSIQNAVFNYDDVPLIISIDKAENDNGVFDVADSFYWEHGEKIIRRFEVRQGLRKHVIQCGDLSEKYGAVIILEDDLVVSPGFYQYVTEALDFYKDEYWMSGIALYSHEWNGYARRFFQPIVDEYDAYLGQFSITWGQCWTKKNWTQFRKWYDKHNDQLGYNNLLPDGINRWSEESWGRYFISYMVENDLYYVIPRIALSTNCSEVGQHAGIKDNNHQVRLMTTCKRNYCFPDFETALKYDVYFENVNLKYYLDSSLVKEGVDIDLNGHGRDNVDNRYVLTTRPMDYLAIKTYGIQYRPIDMNIIEAVSGSGIFLYDKRQKRKNKIWNDEVIAYELRGMPLKAIARFILRKAINRIKNRR